MKKRFTEEQIIGILKEAEAQRLKVLELENSKLKRLLADAHLDIAALKDVIGRKW
jgi:putative transposase